MTSTLQTAAATERAGYARRRRKRPPTIVGTIGKLASWLLIAVLLVVTVYPLFWLISSSFKTENQFNGDSPFSLPKQFAWENYYTAFVTNGFGRYVLNSLLATAPSLALIVLFGVAAGFALEVLVFKGRGPLLLLFVGGLMIPGQIILLPLFNAFYTLGLTGTLWPLIITYTATGLPLTVFMMATFFRAVPREVFEASVIDGASMIRTFFSIGFPIVRNGVFTVALVQFFFIWNDLLVAVTFTNSTDTGTIQVGLLSFNGQYGAVQYGPLLAAICVNVVGILILYLFLNQRIMRGLAAGSVKG